MTDDEEVVFEVAQAGRYVVRVYGWQGAGAPYSLSVTLVGCDEVPEDDDFEENDTLETAAEVEPGEYGGLIVSGDDDFFALDVCAGGTLTASIAFAHADGDLDLQVLDAAGASASIPMDGESFVGLAEDPVNAPRREDLMCESHGHYKINRLQRLLRWGQYKYVAHLGDMDELYDLDDDPYELRNRIDDPALADVLAEARSRVAAWMGKHDDDSEEAAALRAQMGC